MPRAEYHVIAHQDGTGQACSLHEHLLRLHPVAERDHGQHAAFHWHWALPHPAKAHGPNGPEDDSEDAHVPPTGTDLLVEEGPAITHPVRDGFAAVDLGPAPLGGLAMPAGRAPDLVSGPARPRGPAFSGTAARGSRVAWLQRWTC